jgi:hypothetical protein
MLDAFRVVHVNQSVALEGSAEGAGCALACMFSSSDEFEAALIAERRAEGRYGPRKYRKQKLLAFAASALAIVLILAVIV